MARARKVTGRLRTVPIQLGESIRPNEKRSRPAHKPLLSGARRCHVGCRRAAADVDVIKVRLFLADPHFARPFAPSLPPE